MRARRGCAIAAPAFAAIEFGDEFQEAIIRRIQVPREAGDLIGEFVDGLSFRRSAHIVRIRSQLDSRAHIAISVYVNTYRIVRFRARSRT